MSQAPTEPTHGILVRIAAPKRSSVQASTPLLVVEGNYLLLPDAPWCQVHALLDETWFVEVPQALRVQRLTQRHQQFGKSVEAANDWVHHTDEPNARRIEADQAKADLVFRWA